MLRLLQWIVRFFGPGQPAQRVHDTPVPPVSVDPVAPDPVAPDPVVEVLDDEVDEPAPANGLRHNWRTATACWLYPGLPEFWIASHRMVQWDDRTIDSYLSHPDLQGTTHIIICPNTGHRTATYESPYNCLASDDHSEQVRHVFRKVIAADFAPILWCMSQEFFQQTLQKDHRRLLDHLTHTVALLSDLCHMAVPMRELGEIYGGRAMDKRNDIFRAMRRGHARLPLANHERPMTEVPIDDFKSVSGTVISGLQIGFKTPTGGHNRPEDRVVKGDHTYDGGCGFIQANHDRMLKWQQQGRVEEHVNALFEHSLPRVYPTQSWKPTRTIAEAKQRGRKLMQHGAAFDLSSGVRT